MVAINDLTSLARESDARDIRSTYRPRLFIRTVRDYFRYYSDHLRGGAVQPDQPPGRLVKVFDLSVKTIRIWFKDRGLPVTFVRIPVGFQEEEKIRQRFADDPGFLGITDDHETIPPWEEQLKRGH